MTTEQIMEEPKDRCARFELDELKIGNTLTAEEYAELLLGYLVQQLTIKAKFCYMRAIEKFDRDQLLVMIWAFGEQICKQNFSKALRVLKSVTINQPLQIYVEELRRRLTAAQLLAVVRTYSSISLAKFAQMVGLDESSDALQELLQSCQWSVMQDGFINPSRTAELFQTITNLHDPKFGTIVESKLERLSMDPVVTETRNFESLEKLIESTIFFDAMAITTGGESGYASSAVNSNNPN